MKRLLTVSLFLSVRLFGQFDSATILGTVKDKTGGTVAGARVSITNIETAISAEKTTNEEGAYEFFNVRPGRYRITVERAGFAKASTDDIPATVGGRQRVDIEMTVGEVSQTVEVTGAANLLETESSQRGQVIEGKPIVELPLNGRAYSSLVLLSTGVRSSQLSTGSFNTAREGSFNVNGLRSTFNNFLLDGIDNNAYGTSNQGFSNQIMQPPPDAVAEFQVVTNNMSAEYGRSGGAAINVAYRSGTNRYSGAVWEFIRNTQLNATGFFKPVNNRTPPFNRNQFGFVFGGPIKKNRVFFFLDYEGFREVRRFVAFATIPTLNDRQGIFTSPVSNPLTGRVYPANTPIPQSDITAFARRVLADLPAPTTSGAGANFQTLQGFRNNTDKYNAKFDYQIAQNISGFTRIGQRKANLFDEPVIPGPSGGDSNGYTDVINQQLVTAINFTTRPTELLEVRFGVSRTIAGKQPIGLGGGNQYGIPGLPDDPRVSGGLVAQLINGYTNLGRQATNPQWQYPTMWNPKINYSRFFGKHSFKAGYEYQRIHTEIQDVNPLYGEDRYAGGFSGRPITDFLFGLRDRFRLTNLLVADYRQALHFIYLQDDWKVNRRLTLNLGVRYEFATPQWEANANLTNFDPAGLRMIKARFGGIYDRALVNSDRNNVGPRIGLAYSANDKTVIRSGFGMSYIHFHRAGGGNILAINGPQVVNATVNQRPTDPGFLTTEQGYPAGLTAPERFNPLLANITYMPSNWPTSYVMSWFFSIQRQLARNLLLDVAYVGNRSQKLLLFADYNQARPNRLGENTALQLRRPIASFSDITYAFPGGWSNYNSLQVRVDKRFSGGLFLLNSFTWGKALDNGSGALEGPNGNASAPQNFYNLAGEKGLSGYDQKFTNVTSFVYQLPVGKGRKFGSSMPLAADWLVGGWNVSGIHNMWTGATINMVHTLAGAYQVSSIGPDWRGAPRFRPNLLSNTLTQDWRSQPLPNYLNPAAVALPTDNNPFGNAGRNIVRMPNFFSTDFAITKDFRLWNETSALQFRGEFFNVFNRTNFQTVQADRVNPAFGRFLSTFDPRLVQFALRLSF